MVAENYNDRLTRAKEKNINIYKMNKNRYRQLFHSPICYSRESEDLSSLFHLNTIH